MRRELSHAGPLGLLLLLGLLGGCDVVSEPAAQAQPRARPPQQGSIKVKSVETESLRFSAGEPGILHQTEADGLVLRTPVEVLMQAALEKPATMQRKRILPRVAQATITDTRVSLPGPAEADRVLLLLPPGTETLTMAVPRDPPPGAQPVAIAEAITVQVQGQATQPHAVQVHFERGYVAASGLQLPQWLSPGLYYRVEWNGAVWIMMAMTTTGPPAP